MTAVLLGTSSTGIFHSTRVSSGGASIPPPSHEGINNNHNDLLLQFRSTRKELNSCSSARVAVMSQAHVRRRVPGKTNGMSGQFSSGSSDDGSGSRRLGQVNGSGVTKRKAADYDEDIEGFQFSRSTLPKKAKKSDKSNEPALVTLDNKGVEENTALQYRYIRKQNEKGKGKPFATDAVIEAAKRLSIDTPNGKDAVKKTRRRSNRLVEDATNLQANKKSKRKKLLKHEPTTNTINISKEQRQQEEGNDQFHGAGIETTPENSLHEAGTKISLPFADTPVIQRNKEMRKEQGHKGRRRSSLSLRGRRASSLIDSGTSNALPHNQVDTAHFYKHIESDGLTEPRRMRQLLTWCATRALGEKPSGSRSENESARLAARVIQEELLKEIGNRSELADWFSREEAAPPAVVIKKPNPKNIQNEVKVKELEQHIQRLQVERQSLAALLRPPSIPIVKLPTNTEMQKASTALKSNTSKANEPIRKPEPVNASLLHPTQQLLHSSLNQQTTILSASVSLPPTMPTSDHKSNPASISISAVSTRLANLSSSLAPTLDSFASGIYHIELFRSSADNFSNQILSICAQRLEDRDRGTARTVPSMDCKFREEEDERGKKGRHFMGCKKEDLAVVLGALSRLERK